MTLLDDLLSVVGLLLVFVLPGYTVTKALFPEWRVRGRVAGFVALQLLTLAFISSIAITILVGFALLVLPGQGFAATWTNPVLEEVLALIAAIGLGVGMVRGAYSRTPPAARPLEPVPGSDGGWELVQKLHTIDREMSRVRHAMRRASGNTAEMERQQALLDRLEKEAAALRGQREAEYAG